MSWGWKKFQSGGCRHFETRSEADQRPEQFQNTLRPILGNSWTDLWRLLRGGSVTFCKKRKRSRNNETCPLRSHSDSARSNFQTFSCITVELACKHHVSNDDASNTIIQSDLFIPIFDIVVTITI